MLLAYPPEELDERPESQQQKAAWKIIDSLFADAAHLWIIHYSCESFYDRPGGRSPRITSIAVRQVRSAQTRSFSIHQVAEKKRIPFDKIEEHYDELELEMLNDFYAHVRGFQGTKYVHWNMRDINYGFAAIEHRHSVLGGQPIVIEEDKKIDLARLLVDIYGVDYATHPRLTTLMGLNAIQHKDFLSGKQEAEAFDERDFAALHQSTLRKADILADIFERVHDRQLKTSTTWWQMRGGRFRAVVAWFAENKLVALILALAGLMVGLWSILR